MKQLFRSKRLSQATMFAVVAIAVSFAFVGCERTDEGADYSTLEQTTAAWEEAFNAGDAARIADMYTPRARIMPPNAESAEGRAAIQAHLEQMVASGIKVRLTQTDLAGDGDFAYKTGVYEILAGEEVVDRGKYLEVWKRLDGEWQMHRDIWNTSMPQPEAEAG